MKKIEILCKNVGVVKFLIFETGQYTKKIVWLSIKDLLRLKCIKVENGLKCFPLSFQKGIIVGIRYVGL